MKGLRLVFLLLLISINFGTGEDVNSSCAYNAHDLESKCEPCKEQVAWIDLVRPPDGGPETITNKNKTCYNNNPITKLRSDTTSTVGYKDDDVNKVAQGKFRISKGAPKPFSIKKLGFFRYAYELKKNETDDKKPAENPDQPPPGQQPPGQQPPGQQPPGQQPPGQQPPGQQPPGQQPPGQQPPGQQPPGQTPDDEKRRKRQTPPGSHPDRPPAPTYGKSDDNTVKYLDVNNMEKFYDRIDATGKRIFADFQLLEWPGRNSQQLKKEMEIELEEKRLEKCTATASEEVQNSPDCMHNKIWMLRFERDHGKVLHYPCNFKEGIDVVAFASLSKLPSSNKTDDVNSSTTTTTKSPNPSAEEEFDNFPQKIWLSHGDQSMNQHYIQPLLVPQNVLLQMAKDPNGNSECIMIEETLNEHALPSLDLRIVHDFDFTTHRLILGMKCGIIIVSNMETEKLEFKVATIKSELGPGTNLSKDINRISATACCDGSKDKCQDLHIVAAYSYRSTIQPEENHFIYVSFDLGDTFEKKIISSKNSPVNLIRGLFKLYEKWDDYFQILHEPDSNDLDADDALMDRIRKKVLWNVSPTSEKEKLFGFGDSKEARRKVSLERVAGILENRVPARKQRRGISPDRTPKWVNKLIGNRKKAAGWKPDWTEENCPNNKECKRKFEYDRAVEWLLKDSDIHVVTPKRNENEPYCLEIVSILVVPEEMTIKGLCQIGYEKINDKGWGENATDIPPPLPPNTPSGNDTGFFAIFNFPIKKNMPVIYSELLSERVFACKYIVNDMNEEAFKVQPTLIRSHGSGTIFVANCDGMLYVTTNFGRTVFNSVFYFNKEIVEDFCAQGAAKTNYTTNSTQSCHEGLPDSSDPPIYVRSYHICALNVPPLIAVDMAANVFLLTFGKFYARGVVAYNRESRLVVGKSIQHIDYDRRFENLVVPGIAQSGEAILTVALRKVYIVPDTIFRNELYKQKYAIRLVPMLFQFYHEVSNYYDENLSLCKNSLEDGLGFSPCQTISFSVSPNVLELDVHESGIAEVRVKDDNTELPLWVIASNPKSVSVKPTLVKQFSTLIDFNNKDSFNLHGWDVSITARKDVKNRAEEEALVDAFYGTSYNTLHDYATRITLVNTPTIRCHVQPSGTVHVELGCKKKRIVAHEEEHRPQCDTFKNDFKYVLKKGQYDPDMANYWLRLQHGQEHPFVEMSPAGDLTVTYDYSRWGCPIQPFVTDDFIPDLRILPQDFNFVINKTGKAERFGGEFILIELFGAKGYTYTKTVREMMEAGQIKCKRAPQTKKQMMKEWKYRQRLFHLAAYRQKFPKSDRFQEPDFNIFNEVRGNRVFNTEGVKEPISIWNRANYQSCEEEDDSSLTESELDKKYEVLVVEKVKYEKIDKKGRVISEEQGFDEIIDGADSWEEEQESEEHFNANLNKINWGKNHPRVYLFLAIAVDKYDSFCTYQHVFGVSLATHADMDGVTSFFIFLFFTFLWIALLIGGFFFRKRLLRLSYMKKARHERLEQAAWTIIYRYEKLIHGSAANKLKGKGGKDVEHEARLKGISTMHDKRVAELRMKKTAILAQEQAKHDKLQKLFDKE